jgi:GntR family transcriptional regulator
VVNGKPTVEFYLDPRSGVAPYLQIVQQVKQALRLGYLQLEDQLPTMREIVAQIAINPNTVFKAYRTLEMEGLVESRPGRGTFVTRTLAGPPPPLLKELRDGLRQWFREAATSGLDDEGMLALFTSTLHEIRKEGIA